MAAGGAGDLGLVDVHAELLHVGGQPLLAEDAVPAASARRRFLSRPRTHALARAVHTQQIKAGAARTHRPPVSRRGAGVCRQSGRGRRHGRVCALFVSVRVRRSDYGVYMSVSAVGTWYRSRTSPWRRLLSRMALLCSAKEKQIVFALRFRDT